VAATTDHQDHLVSSLGRVAKDAAGMRPATPAILIVGEVVNLAATLLSPALQAFASAAAG
jgi:siroheme synthase